MNNDVAKLGAAVAGGYLLGRTKKGKAALGMALWLAGSRTGLQPRALAREGLMALARSPQTAELVSQLRGPVLEAGRRAAITTLETQAKTLTGALQQRTARLQEVTGAAGEAGEAGTEAAGKAGGAGKDAAGKVGKTARGKRDEDEEEPPTDEVEDSADEEEEPNDEESEEESEDEESPEASDESEQGDEDRDAEDRDTDEDDSGEEQPKGRNDRTRRPAGRAPQKRTRSGNKQKEGARG